MNFEHKSFYSSPSKSIEWKTFVCRLLQLILRIESAGRLAQLCDKSVSKNIARGTLSELLLLLLFCCCKRHLAADRELTTATANKCRSPARPQLHLWVYLKDFHLAEPREGAGKPRAQFQTLAQFPSKPVDKKRFQRASYLFVLH
jgi:ABC-type transport system involved in cytochrome bd biosynthesis fused ATPase/permease subunit